MRPLPILKRNKPKEILTLIRHEQRLRILQNKLHKYHAFDISEAMLMMNDEERSRLYKYITREKLARAMAHTSEEKAATFMLELDKHTAAQLLELMENDDAVDILQHLKYEDSAEFLVLIDDAKQEELKKLSRYKHLTSGSEMNTNFIKFKPEMDVKDAMKILVSDANRVEMIDTLFVVDDNDKLIGVLDLKDLIVAKHPITIGEIMNENFYAVNVQDGIQEVVSDIRKYDTLAMPVLDDSGVIEGIITMYDAMDIIEEEAHDDYAKLAGLPTEDDKYETAMRSSRKRLPWLALLLLLNIVIATVLASFEETIAAITALVLFQPLIFDMAGNIGTQSLAVTILRISKETLRTRVNIVAHLIQEVTIGLLNGALLGGLSFLTAWVFLTIAPIGAVGDTIQATTVAFVVGISVFSALVLSAFLGSFIPIVLNALNIDPAVASGPLVTTINDVTALALYFGLATVLIFNLL